MGVDAPPPKPNAKKPAQPCVREGLCFRRDTCLPALKLKIPALSSPVCPRLLQLDRHSARLQGYVEPGIANFGLAYGTKLAFVRPLIDGVLRY